MLDSDLGVDIGTRITLDKVTLVGSRDFTLLGRPVLPRDLVRVEATVVEKNLSKTEVCNSAVLVPQSDLLSCASACRESFRVFTFITCFMTQPAGRCTYCQSKARYSCNIFQKISPYKPKSNPVGQEAGKEGGA